MNITSHQSSLNGLFNTTIALNIPRSEPVSCIIEGHMVYLDKDNQTYTHGELVIRINPKTLSKVAERYFKQFKCLNTQGVLSRLYVIPKEIVRQNVEGETAKTTSKRTKRNR